MSAVALRLNIIDSPDVEVKFSDILHEQQGCIVFVLAIKSNNVIGY